MSIHLKLFLRNCFCFLLAIPLFSSAQQKYKSQDLGFYLGASYYLGDLNPQGHFKFSEPSGGLIYRNNFSRRWAFKSDLIVGLLRAQDSKANNNWQIDRNLSFKSFIGEFSGQFEFNFFQYETGNDQYPYSLYVFGGLSVFYFDPTTLSDDSTTIYLQQLKTENKKYTLIQPSIPFGIGYKWNIVGKATLAFEWGVRKTFTDYLDDVSTVYVDPTTLTQQHGSMSAVLSNRTPGAKLVNYIFSPSQRGDSSHKDWYSFAGIVFTITISSKSNCPVY